MWIISQWGLFNTDAISFIGETPYETFAICGDRKITISERQISKKNIIRFKK